MKRALALLTLAAATLAGAAEIPETAASGYRAFLEGRYKDAASAFRYVATMGAGTSDTDASLAVIARDSGEREAVSALWLKATLERGVDGFAWNQRAWSYLADGRAKEARDSFLKAIDRSSTTATQAEANVGLGLVALSRMEPKAAMSPLRSALVQGPYYLPAASYETGLTALASGDKQAALAYLRQAIEVDPLHMESLRALAKLYEKIGQNRAAWSAYLRLAALDPHDSLAQARLKKLARFIPGDPASSLPVRRLPRPMLDPESKGVVDPAAATPTIRVALFSDVEGKPVTLTQVYFLCNAPFKIIAANGDLIKDDGRPFDQWEIVFRGENNLVELRDASRNIQYTTKTAFRIVPQGRQGSVLLKSAAFVELSGFDRGDRELRGAIEAQPTPFGFKIVNELPVEDYLYGAVGASLPSGGPSEAYKAQAIVSRTLALWYKAQAPANMERSDICDSRHCQPYVGLNAEMRDALHAVSATEGLVLTREGRLARPMQHEHCGGFTESGASTGDASLAELVSVTDGPSPSLLSSPAEFERFLHEAPVRERYCESQAVTPPSDARWMRLLEVAPLQERADRIKAIGPLRDVRVLRRTASGRVRTLEVVGSRGGFTLEGSQAISDFLSPGSLRSTLFSIQPLVNASGPAQFLLWGAGTGHGLGMCRAGALGQAAVGRTVAQILGVYFPGCEIEAPGSSKSHARPAPARSPTQPRKPLNPRFKKK